MSVAVSFDNVCYSDLLNNLTFEIQSGSCVLITTAREEENLLLASLMTGLKLPDSGTVSISGRFTSESSQEALLQQRSQIGIIPSSGGLVSNLKVWENIFLPYQYHLGKQTHPDEEAAENLLRELDYTAPKMALPAHLTLYQKRVVALVRAMVMKPDLLIYCNIFEKMSPTQQAVMLRVIENFHTECAARTSIFFAPSAYIPFKNGLNMVIPTHGQ